ncbi:MULTISPECIES: cell division protein FtsA [Prevotella]|uniref:Cell division protein FtsA n=1 Tax=Prevotella herbatica TaxID=2801997 RepID=A0ABM7NY87_9BACT|nr:MULTISPECIES: cell division protein FtsA [Prevotella]MDN5552676.1 cell division protein FtsA [Prevotella sp.]BCS85481.1 cell division protein FtsA [Prevotella herbatica]
MAEFIVAIELGSTKITGIAGKKNLDGSITVLAVVKEDSTQCIRKGVVYNIDKTVQCLTNIITRLKTILKSDIAHVYVGVGGQSIRSVKNVIVKDLPVDTIVTQEMVNELMDANRAMSYPDMEILEAATQEYKVDQQYQLDPIGIQCNRLEGNYLNILWHKTFYRNLNKCFDLAGIAIAEMYLAPMVLADSVLSEAEKRSGSVLVDLGAESTTVSVYYKNILRHLAIIPLGGNNITKDIASLQIEESDAEKMKIKYASAYTDNSDIDNNLMLPIDLDRQIENRKFIEIIEARLEEIIENVWFQVPAEYANNLLGGLILTGGGSNMKNIETAFRNHTRIDKIRIAKFVSLTINSTNEDINAHDGKMNTILGILAKGDMNCAGTEIKADLFSSTAENKPAMTTADIHNKPRTLTETTGSGVVRTEAEKIKAEEEEKKKREAEIEAEIKAKELEEERKKKKEASTIHKTIKGLKGFFQKMISEDE